MINIQFINATNVQLRTVGNPKQITYTLNNNEFSCSDSFFSKDDSNYYYFDITGSNVQLSGQITQVTENYQFFNLFRGQTAITDASKLQLQANSVKKFSYANMFLDCTNLRRNPPIMAYYLDQWCFASMFGNCYSLTHAEWITAIHEHVTLKPYCFYCMFYNCKSLVGTGNASQFHFGAYELTDWCCNSMFYGCKSLSSIWCQFNQWSPANATTNWVRGVAQSGWFNNDQGVPEIYGIDNIPSGWSLEQPQPPAPDPTISIASIPDLVWDFETNTTSSVNLTSYITYSNGTGTVTYDLGGTLANGVVFNNGILSANKDLMEDDFSQNFTLSASATDITSTATEDFSLTISGVYQQPPVPVPTITIATIPAVSWDFETATTSSVNLAQYVTYSDGSSTVNYSIVQTLPAGVVFNGGVLSANKSQMTEDITSTLTLSAYASDAEPATKQFSFAVANVEEPEPPVPVGDSLTFTAKSPSNISLQKVGSPSSITLQYNKNNTGWIDYTIGNVINLATNDTVAFSGANDHFSFYNTQDGNGHYYNFQMTGTIEADGNIMSLMNFSNSCDSACFFLLFFQCSSLVKAPRLPASTLADYCYMGMFRRTSITTPPVLSATTLARDCYWGMFDGCTSLTAAPELPATEMTEGCYGSMFCGCRALSTPPVLSATTVGWYCYQDMFAECTSLTSAPQLPATTLAIDCYSWMFEGCTSLTEAPYLPATELVQGCYQNMFEGCSNLSSISVDFTRWEEYGTTDWVNGVASNGTFTKPTDLSAEIGTSYIPSGWTVIDKAPLTFTAKETAKVALSSIGSPDPITLKYKKNSGSWTSYNVNDVIDLASGDKLAFSGNVSTFHPSNNNRYRFVMTGLIEASGNIQSLKNYSNVCNNNCYNGLFAGCSSLLTAPELPATELEYSCYYNMFGFCTSLTAAPYLPATTLADNCYAWMFSNCTSLSSISVAFTDWNDSLHPTYEWVSEIYTNGTFTKPTALSTAYGENYIPTNWTINNLD